MNALHKLDRRALARCCGYSSEPLLATLVFAGGYAVSAHKTVTLTVDGASMTVSTMKSRVIDVVKENGFDVGERDDLYPAGDAVVHQSDTIVLRRSRPLQISLDGQQQPAGLDHRVHRPGGAGAAVDDRIPRPRRRRVAVACRSRGCHCR